jgi:uncharacterized protein (TIGR02453 family)
MEALTSALAPEFGTPKVFRPYRDVRFAKDKTPYKTSQGSRSSGAAPATGWYVEVSARGIRIGAGFYEASSERLAAYRSAVNDERRGTQLASKIVKALEADGWEIGGDRLKTTPRGYSADHPRLDLLRHKSLTVGRTLGFEPVIHTPELLDVVRADWRTLRPLVDWATAL